MLGWDPKNACEQIEVSGLSGDKTVTTRKALLSLSVFKRRIWPAIFLGSFYIKTHSKPQKHGGFLGVNFKSEAV